MELIVQVIQKESRVTKSTPVPLEGSPGCVNYEEEREEYDKVLYSQTVDIPRQQSVSPHWTTDDIARSVKEFIGRVALFLNDGVSDSLTSAEIRQQAEITRGLMKNIHESFVKKLASYRGAVTKLLKAKGRKR